jgi:hypothetical protein
VQKNCAAYLICIKGTAGKPKENWMIADKEIVTSILFTVKKVIDLELDKT